MTDKQLRLFNILSAKEILLSGIISWLKANGLYKECLSVVNPELLEEKEGTS